VAEEYAGRITVRDMIVDALAMKLVLDPTQFDVIVTTNMFGDILSDEIAGLVGGLGMAPGGNIGEHGALFEAVHGSAPDIAGRGIANPGALMLAACMMLDHVGQLERADRIRRALEQTIREDGIRTPDLKGNATTMEFADAVCRRLG
jgi:isocitrate dehydrogenase (NAD+)